MSFADLKTLWPVLSFVLGAAFAIVLQWVAHRLAVKRDQKKEYWIRFLNSYQDFYQQTTQLIDLLRSDLQVPREVYWSAMALARKAAYDASFFDEAHPARTERMKRITMELLRRLEGETDQVTSLDELEREINELRERFLLQRGYTA